MFELFLLVGLGAAVACFLKGHPGKGVAALALIAAGSTFVFVVQAGFAMIVLPVVVLAAMALALGEAAEGSYWDRRRETETTRLRPNDQEPTSRRLGRAVVGALFGLVPAVLFTVGVAIAVEVFDLSGDTAQIGFLGIPIAFFGMVGGALIGMHWVPKKSHPAQPVRKREGV